MPVVIQSTVNGLVPLTTSRNDVRAGDLISLEAIGAANTWNWALVYKPQNEDRTDSAATLLGALNGPGPINFTVDNEGSYLIRLIVNQGLITEQIIFVRIRYLTKFADLSLVAAGERRDDTKTPPNIPFDASNVGWADDQNYNLNNLKRYVSQVASSGRIIYVDANRGKLNSNTPNDPNIAEGYADFSTITAATSAALTQNKYNGGVPPTFDSPMVIAIRPGLYEEDITFVPFISYIAWPSSGSIQDNLISGDRSVTVRTTSAGVLTHILNTTNVTDYLMCYGINFVNAKITTNATLQKAGPGSAFLINCRVDQENNDPTSGACISILDGNLYVRDSILHQKNTNEDRLALEVNPSPANTVEASFTNTSLYGPSVAVLNNQLSPSVDITFERCILVQTGLLPASQGIITNATTLVFSRSEGILENGGTNFLEANPGGLAQPGDLFVGLYWSRLGTPTGSRFGISFDDTGVVGNSFLELGSSEYSAISTIGTVAQRATTLAESLFYDNTISGLTAENVQGAIDEVAAGALNPTLDDAYTNGRVIEVDANAVELHGPGLETAPPPLSLNNGDGTLRTYQQIEVGAIGTPEISLFANEFDNGPSIEMGQRVINTDSEYGSSAHLFSNSVAASFFHYNLRLAAKDAVGNNGVGSTQMGNIILRSGTSLTGSGANSPDGGDLLLYAGSVEENLGGNPGDIYLSPGTTGAGLEGKLHLVDASSSTGATLTAFNNFVDAGATPAGTLTFVTVSGKIEVTFAGGENFAAIQSLLSTGTGFSATWVGAGNPIVLTTTAKGKDAELLLVDDSTAGVLNTYLGDFTVAGGAIFVAGSMGDLVSLEATGNQVLTIGNGTNDLVYDAITGKLTVPGVIDPTAMIFEQVDHLTDPEVTTGATQGGFFVSDGSGGLIAGNPYFLPANDGAPQDLLTGGGGAPVGATYLTENVEGALGNSKRLLGTVGQIGLTPAGSDLVLGLENTGVIANTYRRSNLTIDTKGRVSAASSDPLVFSQGVIIPSGGVLPIVINVYDIWPNDMNAVEVLAFIATPFGGVAAGDITLDVLIRPDIVNPGAFASVIGGAKNIGTLGATAATIVAVDIANKTGPVAIQFQVTFNAIPAAGDGLMITLVGN